MESATEQQLSQSINGRILPLESGDHLTRCEFECRYHAMPQLKKAELIEGIVYVPSPLRFESHARPHGQLITWLGVYEASRLGTKMGDNPTVRLDLDNEPQPDAVLLIDESAGGQSRLSEDGYIEGAPELVVEVTASSAAYDLHEKKTAYRRNGVREYLVWQVLDRRLDWFTLNEGDYVALQPDERGIIRSQLFPGLWLAVSDLLAGNMVKVLTVLQEGLNSSDPNQFVKR